MVAEDGIETPAKPWLRAWVDPLKRRSLTGEDAAITVKGICLGLVQQRPTVDPEIGRTMELD